jgi:hypothetical protein
MMKPFLTSLVVALLGLSAFAQQKTEPCEMPIKYENRNPVDPIPLSISLVSGGVIVETGDPGGATSESSPITEACLGLFTEKEHRLVATAVVDNKSRFTFDTVPSGNYRLVVRAGPLCVANVPLRVAHSRRGAENKGKQVEAIS